MKFSIVYPTRNRPDILEKALYFLEHQTYQNFEIIVSDNYSDIKYSCLEICNRSKLNIIYTHPKQDLNMTENWNYAMEFVTGDYVTCLTDKMFLLPHTLQKCVNILQDDLVDIITWRSDSFSPKSKLNYYAEGTYVKDINSEIINRPYIHYSPQEILIKKTTSSVSRLEQSRSLYCSGKICFGVYSKELIKKIVDKYEKLFHDLSPDYTAMIGALLTAKNAIELIDSGVVYLNAEISNGNMCKVDDQAAFAFLTRSPVPLDNINYLIPNLYSSQHNIVIHDYNLFINKFHASIVISKLNWTVSIYEDLNSSQRIWSDEKVKMEQFALFYSFFNTFSVKEKMQFYSSIYPRVLKNYYAKKRSNIIRFLSKYKMLLRVRMLLKKGIEENITDINEILIKKLYN